MQITTQGLAHSLCHAFLFTLDSLDLIVTGESISAVSVLVLLLFFWIMLAFELRNFPHFSYIINHGHNRILIQLRLDVLRHEMPT